MRIRVQSIAWVFAAVALATVADAQTTFRFDAAPRSADGRFVNPGGPISRPGPSVTFPFFLRRIFGRFSERPGVPARVEPDAAAIAGNPSVTWVGHATLLVRMGGVTFLTDPIWSGVAGPTSFAGALRFVPPGLALDALPPIDFVVVSHNHYDHLDLGTLEELARRHPEAIFLVPLENGALLRDAGIERVVELDWGGSHRIGDVRVHCLPARHWSQRGLRDTNRSLWASWAVVAPERRFYHAGDTAWFGGFARIGEAFGPFDLVAVPIGAYEPKEMMLPSHLDPEQAVHAGEALRARRMLGIHFGTFDLADEPLDEPPRRFLDEASRRDVDPGAAWILRIGETRSF